MVVDLVRALLAICAVLVLALNTGCAVSIQAPGAMGAAAPRGPGLPSAPLTPGAPRIPSAPLSGGQGAPAPGLPGPIAGPGASPATPPTIGLPAPQDDQATIRNLVQTYGIRSIYGSRATGEQLRILAEVLRRFPVGSLRDLDICCEPSEADPQIVANPGVGAYWSSQGDKGGKMFLFREGTNLPVVVHEAGHHLANYADTRFGVDFPPALGYGFVAEGPLTNPADPLTKRVYGTWDGARVPAVSYNRTYARKSTREHTAEMVMVHLARAESNALRLIQTPGFQIPAGAQSMLVAKLGRGQ